MLPGTTTAVAVAFAVLLTAAVNTHILRTESGEVPVPDLLYALFSVRGAHPVCVDKKRGT